MASQGIKIEEIIDTGFDTKNDIAVVKTITASGITDKEAQHMFKKFHNRIIFCADYESQLWKIQSRHADSHVFLRFEHISDEERSLKKYVLLRLSSGLERESVGMHTRSIINFIIQTDNFSDECFDDFSNEPYDYIESKTMCSNLLSYIDFTAKTVPQYVRKIQSLRFEQKVRLIPSFPSILLFDHIIMEYMQEQNRELLYDIVILWWQFTKVIPVRPIEFFTLKKDCLSEIDGRKFIHVKRAKCSVNRTGCRIPLLDKLQVSDEIADLFSSFILKTSHLTDPSDYLFNTEIYRKYALPNTKPTLSREGFIGRGEMYHIFSSFFENIVQEKYGYSIVPKSDNPTLNEGEIERIQYGDTRHIAFLNLLLQGFSPYTIAQIGGHTTINQQLSYYSHIEMYATSKAFALSKDILSGYREISFNQGLSQKYKSSILQLTEHQNELHTLLKTTNGYCLSKHFPHECIPDDCVYCQHCILASNQSDFLNKQKEKLKNELKTKSEYLINVIDSAGTDSENELRRQTAVNDINSTITRMSIINAREFTNEEES